MTVKAWVSAWFLGILVMVAIFIPYTSLEPNQFDPSFVGSPKPPSFSAWLGTDDFGRSLAVRSLFGARISLFVGFVAVFISTTTGTLVGLLSGYAPRWVDDVIMRCVDLMMAIHSIFLMLTLQVFFKPIMVTVVAVIGLSSWMGTARLIRAQVLSVKAQLFVVSAKARGIGSYKILFKHIFPHTLPTLVVSSLLGIGSAILSESVLSFLGLGVQPPHASWGNMLENSLNYLRESPFMIIVPGAWITTTVVALNFLGDALRSMFNQNR